MSSITSELECNAPGLSDTGLRCVGYAMGPDPLPERAELHLRKTFHPLGFSIEVATNSQAVLAAADESWGHFHKSFAYPSLQFHVFVAGGVSSDFSQAPVCRTEGNLFSIVSDAQNFATCDLKGGFASAWLTSNTIENKGYLRYYFLEAVAMCLLVSLHLTPIHAACVAIGNSGVLLCGDSGAGKSSLAFACARAGWTYISDDASYLVRSRGDRFVVGNSNQIRLRPSASKLFVELKGFSETPRVIGKPSIEVPISSLLENVTTAVGSVVEYVVFLDREGSSSPSLISLSKEYAEEQLMRYFWGDEGITSAQVVSLRRLLAAEVVKLQYSDLDSAIGRLEALVR